MSEILNARQQRVYEWLMSLGGDTKAVDFRPYEFLRKGGFLATNEAVARIEADLVEMEEDGIVLIGSKTGAGHMVMVTGKITEALLLTFERMLAMHAMMSDEERSMLNKWEKSHLGGEEQLATSDWPGWRVVFKRLAH